MAASLNKVLIMGNLTRDPELRYIPSGTAVSNFTVAVNRVYKDAAGGKKEEVSYIKVVVWGKMAEVCGEYLSKGRPVLVEGRLKSRTWDTPDGQKRSAMDVVATSVQFLGSSTPRPGAGKKDSMGEPQEPSQTNEGIESIDVDQQEGEEIPF